jgi:hypothetical protein
MRSFTPTLNGGVPGEEAERFFAQQHGGGIQGGAMNLDGMRRELEQVHRGQGPAIKGDRGTSDSSLLLRVRGWGTRSGSASTSISPLQRLDESLWGHQSAGELSWCRRSEYCASGERTTLRKRGPSADLSLSPLRMGFPVLPGRFVTLSR